MRLEAIRLRAVRGFGEDGTAFEDLSPGLNVLAEANEYGKTTLFDALYAVFFWNHRNKKQKEALKLEPYGGGAPQIEVDVSGSAGTVTLAKQYIKRAACTITDRTTGQVLHRGDDAEAFITELTGGDEKTGPSSLLWVRQGRSLEQPDAAPDAATSLGSLLSDEVGDITGGERARRVLAEAEAALDVLVTRERQRPRGDFAVCHEQRKSVGNEIARLTHVVRDTEETREALARTTAALGHHDDPDEAAVIAARDRDAREALKAAEAAVTQERELTNAVQLAEGRLREARVRLETLEALLDEQSATERRITTRIKATADADRRMAQHGAERDVARTAVASAEKAVEDAEGQQASALAAAQQSSARDRLGSLEVQLERVAALIEERKALTPIARGPEIDVAALNRSERHCREAQAVANAALPRMRVEAAGPGVSIDGQSVPEGEECPLSDAATVIVGDARMRIVLPGAAERDTDLEDAERRFASLLQKAAVATVDDARQREAARSHAVARLTEIEKALCREAPDGAAALEDAVASARALAEATPETATPTSVEGAQTAVTEARAALSAARGRFETADKAYREASEHRTATHASLEVDREYRETIAGRLRSADLSATSLSSLKDAAATAADDLARTADTLDRHRASVPDLASARLRVERLEEQAANRAAERNRLVREQARLEEALRIAHGQGAEEELGRLREQGEALDRRIETFERDVRALTLLRDTLSAAADARRERFLAPVLAEVEPFLTTLFDGARLSLGNNLAPSTLERGGLTEPIPRLSGGTREQIAVLTRLGFARMMARSGQSVPVVLDDALVYSDDDRIERMFDAIYRAGQDMQILVLTCRQRTFATLGHRITGRPWPDARSQAAE